MLCAEYVFVRKSFESHEDVEIEILVVMRTDIHISQCGDTAGVRWVSIKPQQPQLRFSVVCPLDLVSAVFICADHELATAVVPCTWVIYHTPGRSLLTDLCPEARRF